MRIRGTFHGICPPTYIQTWMKQYSRGALFYSAHCSSSAITFVSDLCGVDVQWFQERSSQALPNSQGIVSVNDFRLPVGLQELLHASLSFLWSFCFARICLDPLGGEVLHHDCISVIVSRFAIVNEDLVICCYQVTKFFSTRYSSTIAFSAWGPCNFGPFTDLAISVFGEVSINTVFTQILTSLECGF